jgi:endonuclease/exonuclease/phosphatase (EEP) superfamily protein YafD
MHFTHTCARRYTASILLLLSWRAKIFTAKKWHYFLLDFCYFINAMCLVYLALTHLHPW